MKGILAVVCGCAGFMLAGCSGDGATTPPASGTGTTSTSASISASTDDNRVLQYYWYCWDNGMGSPHHLGHRTIGDHLCTQGELRRAGM